MGSKATYSLDLDVETRAAGVPILRVGDRVTGTARITPNQDIKLNSVAVKLLWKAHGKGSSEEGVVEEFSPPRTKSLAGGQETSLPFDFALPMDGPVSYDGEYVKISWLLRVYLDIPWAIDDEEDFPLLVLPTFQ
jgi:sporulation-control protein spo0M